MTIHDSNTQSYTFALPDRPVLTEPDRSRSIPLWQYMTLDEAYYIIDDMTSGQLISFEPPQFKSDPSPALVLYKAAKLVYGNGLQRKYVGQFTPFDKECQYFAEEVLKAAENLAACYPECGRTIQSMINGVDKGDQLPSGFNRYIEERNKAADAVGLPQLPAPKAKSETRKKTNEGYVYVLRSPTGAYKIGLSRNPQHRLETFSVKLPFEVEYDTLIKTDDMRGLEAQLHSRYAHKRINGEWFALDEDDLAELRAMGAGDGD